MKEQIDELDENLQNQSSFEDMIDGNAEIDKLLEQGQKSLEKFYENADKNYSEKIIDTNDKLRTRVASFVGDQMNIVHRQDALRRAVEAEMLQRIALHQCETSELMQMYKIISAEKSQNTDVLLKLFAPTNTGSTMLTMATNDENKSSEIELDYQQRNALAKLTSILGGMNQ